MGLDRETVAPLTGRDNKCGKELARGKTAAEVASRSMYVQTQMGIVGTGYMGR